MTRPSELLTVASVALCDKEFVPEKIFSDAFTYGESMQSSDGQMQRVV